MIAKGVGLCFMDPHGVSVDEVLGVLGELPVEHIIFLDFEDDFPVAYNAFANIAPEDIGDLTMEFLQTMKPLLDTEGLHRTNDCLSNALYGHSVIGVNLASLLPLISPGPVGDRLRQQIIREVKNDAVRHYWREVYPTRPASDFAPILNRLTPLFMVDKTLRTFSQQENKVDIPGAMAAGKVILIKLPKSIEAQRIVGGFLIGRIKHAAFRRPRTAPPFYLIVDEASRFAGSGFHQIFDEATKFQLSLWLVHQQTNQIPPDLAKTILGIDTCVFGVNGPDAKMFAQLFNSLVAPEILASLPTGSCYARLGQDVVNFECPVPLTSDPAVAARIIRHSRAKYYATETTAPPTAPAAAPRAPRPIKPLFED